MAHLRAAPIRGVVAIDVAGKCCATPSQRRSDIVEMAHSDDTSSLAESTAAHLFLRGPAKPLFSQQAVRLVSARSLLYLKQPSKHSAVSTSPRPASTSKVFAAVNAHIYSTSSNVIVRFSQLRNGCIRIIDHDLYRVLDIKTLHRSAQCFPLFASESWTFRYLLMDSEWWLFRLMHSICSQ